MHTWKTRIRWVKGKPRRERWYEVGCPTCNETRWLRSDEARAAERDTRECFRCAQTRKARLGFQAMVKRWGWRWAMRHVQAYRQQQIAEGKAPATEEAVAARLDTMGLDYVREYALATKTRGRRKWVCLIDFMVVQNGQMWAIEVNGGVHVLAERQRADRRKRALLKRRGHPLLVLTEADMPLLAERLGAFLMMEELVR